VRHRRLVARRTTLSAPPSGWLAEPPLVYQLLAIVLAFQKNFWALAAAAPSIVGDVGSNPEPSAVNLLNIPPLTSNVSTSGFLGAVRADYFILPTSNFSDPTTIQLGGRPYFQPVRGARPAHGGRVPTMSTEPGLWQCLPCAVAAAGGLQRGRD